MNAKLHQLPSHPIPSSQALAAARRGPMPVRRACGAFLLAAAALLAGCGTTKAPASTLFDFGPAAPAAAPNAANPMAALVFPDATGSGAFDSERMFYRLDHVDAQQARTYANSRWNVNPLQMVTQRLKIRIAQSGTKVLSAGDASAGVPILRVEMDDFVHAFTSDTESEGRVALRASLFYDHALVDQKTFSRAVPAPSANAAGGARALAAATDAISADMVLWLAGRDLRKR